MSERADTYLPDISRTADGSPRRCGVELEFIGLRPEQAAQVVADTLDGEVERRSDYEYRIEGDAAGAWQVERDQTQLKELGRTREEQDGEQGFLDSLAESALRLGSDVVVPVELVSPPLEMKRLADFQAIVDALRSAGARGTQDNPIYAFGLQFNPELPALDATTILKYLQAFLCLEDWLVDRGDVDSLRQLTRFARPFPASYARTVCAEDYAPELAQLMDDYLADNPTRNRSLDCLPLFMHIDEPRLREVVDDPRVKPRPTFHYRLPNSLISDPDWSIYEPWADWLVVEWLASDDERRADLCARYVDYLDSPLGGLGTRWHEEVSEWLNANR